MTTLAPGEWLYFKMDYNTMVIPTTVHIYTGSWEHRKSVRTVSHNAAMALWRWHGEPVLYYSVRDGNGKFFDIRVAGDIDAFHGDGRDSR